MLQDVIRKTLRLLGYTIQYGCIAHCAFEYIGGIVVCSGPSMEPTIQNSDIVFSENLSLQFYNIQKGDIIIAKNPSDPKSNICKRVIGLEGDKVCTSSPSDFLKTHSYILRQGSTSSTGLPFSLPVTFYQAIIVILKSIFFQVIHFPIHKKIRRALLDQTIPIPIRSPQTTHSMHD
ncbi:mitochondrial inner membrane protease subunit 1 isoform X2 [Podarcis raffonei]|uniref:mitochondrial inner membrane protease subunit 1 isoform X2 n=1 Tax=Podarcis raffonei TaxID=65483 RepID=UPI0023295AD0|nr:mitochondrial inner membrane protease subunit 1 isoform X2 [Podarcis raffonei]XP_053245905.1 mitochondrial inner membrane protease subunit 1 isoform X2 [Podarcis raffonei]XP_053245914.1 mitochondrial inner membrane protease subunit 1 isoform X2 [Podarcis raffonei]XP_053245924.1 mitochondrial inner membrane protease subunit 1 isoform X2 [Podarcis raffonei]XP_053245931.1 mitochondrial inner membrane protease subunit 1 isoform X2 [Podarcis raffonei]